MSSKAASDIASNSYKPVTSTTASSGASVDPAIQVTSREIYIGKKMDEKVGELAPAAAQEQQAQAVKQESHTTDLVQDEAVQLVKKLKKCRKTKHKKGKKRTKSRLKNAKEDSSDSESDAEDDSSESSSDSESSSEEEKHRKKSKRSKRFSKKNDRRRSKRSDGAVEDGESDSESSPDRRRKKHRRHSETSEADPSEVEDEISLDEIRGQIDALSSLLDARQLPKVKIARSRHRSHHSSTRRQATSRRRSSKKTSSPEYKRVDQLWDSSIHNYKLKESAEDDNSEFAEYAFLVRRRFDWENKYLCTVVDIKSKDLRAALAVVMKECKSVSLETEEPCIDPNLLFLYVEEIRTYYKKTLKVEIKKEKKKRKTVKKLETQRALCKTLVKYIDSDYADTKKTLYPLLKAGNITFDLVWALFHPNDIAVTSTYGVWDEPRCFKVEYANKFNSLSRGEFYSIEGKYMEYDGKSFGYGDFEAEIDGFKGPRRINSLATYPLKYHKDPASVKKQIIERGKRFVATEGMNYKFHKGLAFMKKKKQVLKININGRVMVDPATFRRINPNYQVSVIKAKDADDLFDECEDEEDDDNDCCSCCSSNTEDRAGKGDMLEQKPSDTDEARVMYKFVEDEEGNYVKVAVEVDENGDPIRNQKVEQLGGTGMTSFSEDDLLLTSSVVLGFAFSEKLWLEFTLSGVREIEYNENAFESLVLPPNQKSIVRALVESHKFNAAKTIDDVVQGKGKGLVAVLHGPPGTGKTLTAEGISELLKCPLYMVSAGELGTDPARLELELQKILDIAHSWGAVLLLDEADVFLEKRENHDIHRNALVSIFLRLLEYFQGILFLTTNRVETFDDAFQSRIHVALRYGELTVKAKKAVWKLFLDMCRKGDGCGVAELSENDLDALSRHQLNGRQIKNVVRTAQALALNEKQNLTLGHIKRVLDVAETFDRDLKGGTGYVDAMRSYT